MKRHIIVLALCLLVATPGYADILGGVTTGGAAYAAGGTFALLTPPLTNSFGPTNSVGLDNFESVHLFGFNELQNVLLTTNLYTDYGTNPIPAGTVVSSHYIFFDPATNQDIAGMVGFTSNVLAVISTTTNLANSDFLSAPGVNYLGPAARGLESGDSVAISGTNKISVQLFAGSPGDYIRVITVGGRTPDPVVDITPSGTNCVVSWTTNSAGYVLQVSTSLNLGSNWVNHPGKPVVIGTHFKLTNAISGPAKFFRLIRE